jgi:hypothetical protein
LLPLPLRESWGEGAFHPPQHQTCLPYSNPVEREKACPCLELCQQHKATTGNARRMLARGHIEVISPSGLPEPRTPIRAPRRLQSQSPDAGPEKNFSLVLAPPRRNPKLDCSAASKQYTCTILQHLKRMGEPGYRSFAGTQIRPRRVKSAQFASFCGRWADLANFCSDRPFRSRAVVPLRLNRPSCLFRPRASLFSVCSVAQKVPKGDGSHTARCVPCQKILRWWAVRWCSVKCAAPCGPLIRFGILMGSTGPWWDTEHDRA